MTALMNTQTIGHLAITTNEGPLVVPVEFFLDGTDVLIRTSNVDVLSHAPRTIVAFGIDDAESGQSVMVRGRLHDITETINPYAIELRTKVYAMWAVEPDERLLHLAIK